MIERAAKMNASLTKFSFKKVGFHNIGGKVDEPLIRPEILLTPKFRIFNDTIILNLIFDLSSWRFVSAALDLAFTHEFFSYCVKGSVPSIWWVE